MTLRRQVFLRLGVLTGLIVVILTVGTSTFVVASHRAEVMGWEIARLRILSTHLERLILWDDRTSITRLLRDSVSKDAFRRYAFVTNSRGPLAWTFARGIPPALLAQSAGANAGRPASFVFRDRSGHVVTDVAEPVPGKVGVLHVGIDRAAIDASARPLLIRIGLVGLGGWILGLLLAAVAARRASREVTTLSEALASATEAPDFGPMTPVASTAELQDLVALFERQMKEREKTADELARQRDFLDSLLEALTYPFYVIDARDYTIRLANSAARKHGIAGGIHCYEVTHGRTVPCDDADHPCPLETVRATGRPTTIEHSHTTPEGERHVVEIRGYPILDETGAVEQMILYTIDITKHKLAEEALRESHSRYKQLYTMGRLMADNLPDMLWAKDLEGRYLFANRAICDRLLMARDTEEPIGKTDLFFAERERAAHPDDPNWHTFGEVCSSSDARVLETRLPLQVDEIGYVNGQFVWLDVRKAPLFDRDDTLIGTVGSARDVTKERERDEERRRLQTAIEQADMGVLILDADGRVVYANPAHGRITGYAPEEIIGRGMDFIRSQYEEAKDFEEMQAILSTGKAWRGRVRKIRKDGTAYVQEELVAPVRNAEGAVINIVAYLRDVTPEVELEARYFQAQKLESIGRLAGGIAHDFNNLLGAIRAYAELVQMELSRCDGVQEYVEEILAATEHGAGLTRHLLAFARRQPAAPQLLDVNQVIRNLEGMLGQLIGEDIQLTIGLEPGLPAVLADPAQIEQVLVNLVVNARDAMPSGGRVSITTRAVEDADGAMTADLGPGRWIAVSVSDTGVGMTDEVLQHVFEPFFTTKESGKGTGLGLSTCFGIVSQAGGKITVDSQPGAGTTMTVYLPQAGVEPDATIEAPDDPAVCGGTETILFVEDEPTLRQAMANELRALGYTIIEAGDGLEALDLWRANAGTIDLLLTDEVMPHMAGSELARDLRALDTGLKVIIISGYGTADLISGKAMAGDALILNKPLPLQNLATEIRHLLDSHEKKAREKL